MILALFLGFFGLALYTCAPHLAPYRDAGEMASLLKTLGVAHPPGYPLYTLAGRLMTLIPMGNFIYRTNVFSALCAAGALVFMFLTLRNWLKPWVALAAVLFLGFSNPFWDLATVSEMYALGVLWLNLLFYVTFRLKNPLLFSFLMALGLGVRMDMLLLVPLFVGWFYWTHAGGQAGARREIPWMAAAFTLGASVFFYLMFRSRTDPLMDWANPDNLLAVFNSARRKNYSGTLDLLSLSYRAGENFVINLQLYAKHVVASFGWWGAVLALLGVAQLWRTERRGGIFFGIIFLVTGPVFLYLANMPPNPHSLAIVEASYLVPDVMVALFIAWGIALVSSPWNGNSSSRQSFGRDPGSPQEHLGPGQRHAGATMLMAGVTALLLCVNAVHGFTRASKRHNLYARDFVENVFRSLPKNSVVVFHKDVQLFSLWAAQLVDMRRLDVSVVADGLSASAWYWDMKKRWNAASSPEISLKEPEGWETLKSRLGDRQLFFGYDVEFNGRGNLKPVPYGSLFSLGVPGPVGLLPAVCLYRGPYIYGQTPDFFSTDLIGDAARAHHQQAFALMMNQVPHSAEWFFSRSQQMNPTFARAYSDHGYLKYSNGDVAGAYTLYGIAAERSEDTLKLLKAYRSLPEVATTYEREAAAIYTQWGAMAERLQKVEEARGLYQRALGIQENAQSHYNLAVTYWGKDWNMVISHMRRAVELNPQMNEARAFLAKAEAMQRGGR